MSSKKELTVFERGMIVGLHKGNHSASDISSILKIPRTTCQSVIKNFCEKGLTDVAPRSGRPPLLTEREKRTLIRKTRENRKDSLEEITEYFNKLNLTQISNSIARRILHKNNYFGRIGKRKPFISEDNRKKRLKWCQEHKTWNGEWDNVIWIDKSRFLLFQNDEKQWV